MGFESFNFPPKIENKDTKKAEKQKIWDETAKKVEIITDGLGMGIDKNIKEVVISFLVNGFNTEQSCEGHREKERGLPFPWVDVSAPEPEGWQKNDVLKNKWLQENLKQREEMASLLKEFYSPEKTMGDEELILQNKGVYGAFRIFSKGAEKIESKSEQPSQEKLELYRKEMRAFADFLKEKYFSQ